MKKQCGPGGCSTDDQSVDSYGEVLDDFKLLTCQCNWNGRWPGQCGDGSDGSDGSDNLGAWSKEALDLVKSEGCPSAGFIDAEVKTNPVRVEKKDGLETWHVIVISIFGGILFCGVVGSIMNKCEGGSSSSGGGGCCCCCVGGQWGSGMITIGSDFLHDTSAPVDAQGILRAAGVKTFRMFERHDVILGESSRRRLIQHADEKHQVAASGTKLVLLRADLEALIGSKDLGALEEKFQLFGGHAHAFELRRVEANGKGRWINFHTDSIHPYTMQIPLNDEEEIEGGRTVFVTETGIVTPDRKAGSVLMHDASIVHGVTAHTHGVRYSLFLLEENKVPPPLFGYDAKNFQAHWQLLIALVGNEEKLPSTLSDEDWAWWRAQIALYEGWLHGVATYLKGRAVQDYPLPMPPRMIRYVWIAHMLQPMCYHQDCFRIFGAVLPHDNAASPGGGADFIAWWRDNHGCEYPDFKGKVDLSVDWRIGIDSADAIYHDVKKVLEADTDVESILLDYRRYLFASFLFAHEGDEELNLAPGPLVDLCWHAHMCTPVSYSMQMIRMGKFVNHVPCGAFSPPDPAWAESTDEVWAKLFPGERSPTSCWGAEPLPASDDPCAVSAGPTEDCDSSEVCKRG